MYSLVALAAAVHDPRAPLGDHHGLRRAGPRGLALGGRRGPRARASGTAGEAVRFRFLTVLKQCVQEIFIEKSYSFENIIEIGLRG